MRIGVGLTIPGVAVRQRVAKALAGVIAVIGDSIPAGYQASYGWPTQLGYPVGVTVNNTYSQSGHLVANIAADVPSGFGASIYDATKPCVMILERGVNDIRTNGTTGQALYTLHANYISEYQAKGFYVAIQTLLPFTDGGGSLTEVAAYNALVRANSGGADAILDFAADSVMGAANAPDNTSLYVDKLHPTTAGQDRLALIAKPVISGLLSNAPRATSSPRPTVAAAPTFTGTAKSGQALAGARGSYGNSPTSYTNQWQRSTDGGATWSPISGQTTLNYTLVDADIGYVVRLVETATNAAGNSQPNPSAASAVIAAASVTPNPNFVGTNFTMTSPAYASDTSPWGQKLSGGYGTIPAAKGTPSATPYAIALRIDAPAGSASGVQIICSQGNRFCIGMGGDGKLTVQVSGSAGDQFIGGGDFSGGGTGMPVLPGTGSHWLVLNVSTTGATIAMDGTVVGTLTGTTPATGANATVFGVRTHGPSAGSFIFAGNISELAILNAAYSNANRGTPLSIADANVTELWHFDGNGSASAT